jgi:hypothetical protein
MLFAYCEETSMYKTLSTGGTDTSGYQLIWSDEFNGTTVDTFASVGVVTNRNPE